MNGIVDAGGRALLDVELKPAEDGAVSIISAWIDTAFTGDLVLPTATIDKLALPLSGTVGATLADGSKIAMPAYACHIRWFDDWQHLEVVASDAKYTLLGVGLLWDHELFIDYRACSVKLA